MKDVLFHVPFPDPFPSAFFIAVASDTMVWVAITNCGIECSADECLAAGLKWEDGTDVDLSVFASVSFSAEHRCAAVVFRSDDTGMLVSKPCDQMLLPLCERPCN